MPIDKSFNSILFDFDSIIDLEINLIRDIRFRNKKGELQWIDDSIFDTLYEDLKKMRMNNQKGIFKSFVTCSKWDEDTKERVKNLLIERDKKEILDLNPFSTRISSLIPAYRIAGNGVIKTIVRCNDEIERDFIKENYNPNSIIISKPEDVDTTTFSRIVIGNVKEGLRYNFESPKSIIVINYAENFTFKDGKKELDPIFVIKFGDIHQIGVTEAYQI